MILRTLLILALRADPSDFLDSPRARPLFHSLTGNVCLVDKGGDDRFWVYVYPPEVLTAKHAAKGQKLEASQVGDRCGEGFAPFRRLLEATCGSRAQLTKFLQTSEALAFHTPKLPEALLQYFPVKIGASYWNAAEELGCARVVTSSDGRARVWTTKLEKFPEEDSSEEASNMPLKPERGEAALQWKDAAGIHVAFDQTRAIDLHLDTVVDVIEPVPGKPQWFLLLGLRAYVTTYPGDLPRRYAEVVQLDPSGTIALVPNTFSVGRTERSQLLFTAPPNEVTGKFRHHPLARQWLQLDGTKQTLQLEIIDPQMPIYEEPKPDAIVRVAKFDGSVYRVSTSKFGSIRLTERWGPVSK